jgi:hypothetical protein
MLYKPTPRRGAATLELVFVFPFLLTICAVMVFLGRGVMMKTSAATEARQEAFEKKTTARSGELLAWLGRDPLDGVVRAEVDTTLQTNQLLGNFNIEERAAVTGDTWDAESVPMGEIGVPFMPHMDVLTLIASNGKVGGNMSGPNELASGLSSLQTAMAAFVAISQPVLFVIKKLLPSVETLLPVVQGIRFGLEAQRAAAASRGDFPTVIQTTKQLGTISKGLEGLRGLMSRKP